MKTYAIVAKKDNKSGQIVSKITKKLDEFLSVDNQNPDVVISIGGDGTMLQAIHKYLEISDQACFVGIHTGTLGFYTDYLADEVDEVVMMLKNNKYEKTSRNLLRIDVFKDNLPITHYAMNEARIENNYYTQTMNVYIDNEELEVFRGNGLCISTNSGSTAYNKSLGGSVVDPTNKIMQLTEIAGISHNIYRSLGSPLILSKEHTILIKGLLDDKAILGVDHLSYPIEHVESIRFTLSDKTVSFISDRDISFVGRIKKAFIY